MDRYCSAGKHTLDESKFWKRGRTFQPNCSECQRKINKERYASNPRKHITNVVRNSKSRLLQFQEWKCSMGCQVCHERYYACLDLHHVDPHAKEEVLSKALNTWSKARVEQELKKCVVVCKNCHTKIHGGQIDSHNLQLITEQELDNLWSNPCASTKSVNLKS